MVMRDYGCEPELGLRLGSGPSHSSSSDNSIKSNRVEQYLRRNTTQHQQQHLQHKRQRQQQQITIFYNGRMSTCDVTEIQARAIICMARREMEKRTEKSNHHQHDDDDDDQEQRTQQPNSSLPRPALAPQLINPVLPMKRSLQRFLQKRKTRMHAYTPYTYAAETPSPSSSYS